MPLRSDRDLLLSKTVTELLEKLTITSRRKPQQSRSRALVDVMLEAVSRLVDESGFQLTTNKVADLAGVSVGSVYRYFSSKESLLRAWVEQMIAVRAAHTRERLAALLHEDVPLDDALRQLVDAALGMRREASFEARLTTAFLRFGGVDALNAADAELLPLVRELLLSRGDELRAVDPELAAFVLLHAWRAVIVAAAQDENRLQDPRLREELVHLARAYLKP